MLANQVPLFSILGFKVSVDPSWLILVLLLTWSLARGLFPFYFKDLPSATYWWMGLIGSLGLFCSIIYHELCHSLIARKFGIPMKGITLFIFGGVAEMDEEPPSAKSEFSDGICGSSLQCCSGGNLLCRGCHYPSESSRPGPGHSSLSRRGQFLSWLALICSPPFLWMGGEFCDRSSEPEKRPPLGRPVCLPASAPFSESY